jgi:hypothetical protein
MYDRPVSNAKKTVLARCPTEIWQVQQLLVQQLLVQVKRTVVSVSPQFERAQLKEPLLRRCLIRVYCRTRGSIQVHLLLRVVRVPNIDQQARRVCDGKGKRESNRDLP